VKRRKGAGYLIEGIISILVVLIFVAGTVSTDSDKFDWSEFEGQTTADDITYSLKKTDHMDSFVARGERGSLKGISAALTERRMSVGGSVTGVPYGEYSAGIYVDQDDAETVVDDTLEEVDSLDRCGGDLEELPGDDVLRTDDLGGLEGRHGIRMYFADAGAGQTQGPGAGYDSVWVDNYTRCQFNESQGPHRLGETVSLNDNHYQFEIINGKKEAVFFNDNLSHEVRRDMKQLEQASVEVDRFNFSDNLGEYDLLIFNRTENLDDIESFEQELSSYARKGRILFVMDLEKSHLENNKFLKKTGLEWIGLDTKDSVGNTVFGNNSDGRKVERYYEQLGFSPSDLRLEPDSKLGSGLDTLTREEQLVSTRGKLYDKGRWTDENKSMTDPSSTPDGLPGSDCNDPYRHGKFDVGKDLDLYSIKLSKDCDQSYGLGFKLYDGNEPVTEVLFNRTKVKAFNRSYSVEIFTHEHAKVSYAGDTRMELFNHRKDFEDGRSRGFGVIPANISSESPESNVSFMTAAAYRMLEEGKSFGDEGTSDILTSTAGRTEKGSNYRINMRWIR